MKGDNMEQHRIIGFIGAFLMIFCLVFPFIVISIRGPLLETPPILIFILIITGFALVLYGLCKEHIYRSQGAIVKDERTRKIRDKSRSYTLYVTIPFIIIVVSLYRAVNLELNYGIVWLVILQVVITQIIFRLYLNKKKDL